MPQLLPSICALIGTIPIGFGVNAFLRPDNALSFFNGASMPVVNANLVQALVMIYAARDVFMGIAIYATAYYGSRRALGWVMLAGGFNAFIDGLAAQTYLGGGECEYFCAQVVCSLPFPAIGMIFRTTECPIMRFTIVSPICRSANQELQGIIGDMHLCWYCWDLYKPSSSESRSAVEESVILSSMI
jgi:hypothetical protein